MKTFCCVLILAVACLAEDLLTSFNRNNNEFTAKLTAEVISQNPNQSVVLSGFSVLPPLAQLAMASVGETRDELFQLVGINDDNPLDQLFPYVTDKVLSVNGIKLKLANKLYIKTSETVNKSYAELTKQQFGSEIQNIDFSKAADAAGEINNWVEYQTEHRIKDLVDPKSLSAATRLVLVNAVYFKAAWAKKFDEANTKPRDFYGDYAETTVQVPTMHSEGQYKYAVSERLDAQIIELPYAEFDSSLVIVLPNKNNSLRTLLDTLNKGPRELEEANGLLEYKRLSLYLPKFKIETKTDLKQALQNIGVTSLFTSKPGNLQNLLVDSNSGLFIDGAVQKAFIEVDEKGTEAAAANAFIVFGSSGLDTAEPIPVHVDRPFYFQVKAKNTVLFNGVVRFNQ